MPILAPDVGQDMIPYVYAIQDDLLVAQTAPHLFNSGTYPMKTIQVAGTVYKLRRPLQGRAYLSPRGEYEFVVDALAPHVAGKGASVSEAIDDWRMLVHASIQQMLAMRPFEMSIEDARRWRAFESVIDTSELRRTTPIRMRQLGRVEYLHTQYPQAIHWMGGGRERVSLDAMPSEFPSYKPGQWIEAICERDPLTSRLLRVAHIERIPQVRMMSRDQQDQYWASLPTSTPLPESDLDWTRTD